MPKTVRAIMAIMIGAVLPIAGVIVVSNTSQAAPSPVPDAAVSTAGDVAPPKGPRTPWYLDRIDQRKLPLDGQYHPVGDGAGVDVYVIDSGIRATHGEFEGRVVSDINTSGDQAADNTDDCAGHGTFVASLIAGKTFGVAKKATLHAVRVMDCNNSFKDDDQVVKGMDWVAQHHDRTKPAIANVSLESEPNGANGDSDPVLDKALSRLIDSGVIVVSIAGNFGRGDCQNSPKDPRAIVAGATDVDDFRNFRLNASSFGPCVTLFAPGADMTAAGIGQADQDAKTRDTAVQTGFFGTSFAAPLIVGTLAIAAKGDPALTQEKAKSLLVSNATRGVLREVGLGSPNLLLFSRWLP